ncbi:ABC transporter permease [Streptococcus jiangjianxini]|uniref:ABC transporter permease n=1 Tax=Streptococcus jiangjianxini TaxID=3161189 RepID=UPI0032EB02BF
MNALTRAQLYLKRHYIKTVILTSLLLIVSLSLTLLISLNATFSKDIQTLSQVQSKRFMVTKIDNSPEHTTSSATRHTFQKVASRYHLKANHLITEVVTVTDKQQSTSRPYSLINQEFLSKAKLLKSKSFLATGTYLTDCDVNKALVSQRFAQKYQLKPGEHFTIKGANGSQHTLAVAGIFKVSQSPITNRESDSLDNNIITTQATLTKVNPNYTYQTSYYEASTKTEAMQAQTDLQTRKNIAKEYQLKKDASIQAQLKGLKSQQRLFKLIFWGTLVLSTLILAFFLNLWMKSRQLEIGILQSLGKSRGDILLQYILEILIVASVSVVVALLISNLLLPSIRASLLHDLLSASYENTDNAELMPIAFLANHLNLEQLVQHTTSLKVTDISYSIVTNLALAVGAVFLACSSLLRYSPKKLFAMMS